MKWTWRALHVALNGVPGIETVSDGESAFGNGYKFDHRTRTRRLVLYKAVCEARLHEILHGVLLGHGVITSRQISHIIDDLDPEKSDQNELQTLAAELVLFRRLGLPADDTVLDTLVEFAYDNLRSGGIDSLKAARHMVLRMRSTKAVLGAASKTLDLLKLPSPSRRSAPPSGSAARSRGSSS